MMIEDHNPTKKNLVWIIPLILLLGILSYLLLQNRDKLDAPRDSISSMTPEVSVSPVAVISPVSSIDSENITDTDLKNFFATADAVSLAGRSVNFQSVTVKRVTGDKTFVLSADRNGAEQVYVVLVPQRNDDPASEQNLQFKEGQMLSIGGTVKVMPSLEEVKKQWSLTDQEAADAKKFGVYLEASTVSTK